MNFVTRPQGLHTTVISIGKNLDFRNASDFDAICQEQIAAGFHTFILDFTGTDLLDSAGLAAIFSLYRQLRSRQGAVAFASVSRPVGVVVQLTRTHRILPQFKTVNAALAELAPSAPQAEMDWHMPSMAIPDIQA